MVRKQIVIEPEQQRSLESRAASLGISQSALIREALDAFLKGATGDARKRWAWNELQSGMRDSAKASIGSRGRVWAREDLHER